MLRDVMFLTPLIVYGLFNDVRDIDLHDLRGGAHKLGRDVHDGEVDLGEKVEGKSRK